MSNIEITDKDIEWVEGILGGITFDESRRNVIKHLSTTDIQACPGSGKTTVLVAKLAILARNWNLQNEGICVLSHTNVAREEIQERLGNTEVGKKLLSYPHFIGTFHSFFNTFIGLPFLKSSDRGISIIDSDLVLERRWGRIQDWAKKILESKKLTKYACEAKALPLRLDLGLPEGKTTYKTVKKVVLESMGRGEFTFDEMILIAEHALNVNEKLSKSVRKRFPFLFIDEAQDTSDQLWRLIHMIFEGDGSQVIIQGYGDSNQAIYNSYQNEVNSAVKFPKAGALRVDNSHRFGDSIAKIANTLAVDSMVMTGYSTEFSNQLNKNVIFLFEDQNIELIPNKFAEHVLANFTDSELNQNKKYGCHVIGMVHKESESTNSEVAERVSDYWSNYTPYGTKKTPSKLIDYFYRGQSEYILSHETSRFIDWSCKGLIRYLTLAKAIKPPSGMSLGTLLRHVPEEAHQEFRNLLLEIMFENVENKSTWDSIVGKIDELFGKYLTLLDAEDFTSWKESELNNLEEGTTLSDNRLLYRSPLNDREVDLFFGSIHSCKGRTHLATLVLETKWYEKNIKSLLPWLTSKPKKLGVRNQKRMLCHYVALTRAKGIVCIALPKKDITSGDISNLKAAGWEIEIV